jgi:hypothetical protein
VPVSFEFLRGIVGVLGIGCSYMTGRSYALLRKGQQSQFRFFGWVLRTLLCLVAVALRHSLDTADIAIGALCLLAFAVAVWDHSRVKKEEDLTRTMFPE